MVSGIFPCVQGGGVVVAADEGLIFRRNGGTVRTDDMRSFGRGSGLLRSNSGRFESGVGTPKGRNSVEELRRGLEDLMVVLRRGSLGFL